MANRVIHLFNGFLNPNGGSELEALALAEQLRAHGDVRLWATSSRSPASLRERHSLERIGFGSACRGIRPEGGTYVFVGAHWRNKLWPFAVPAPERLIYVFNTFHPKILSLTSQHPRLLRWPRTEYVFISEFQRTLLDTPGVIHPSPIDIARFTPAAHSTARRRPVIGRLSRDTLEKHDAEDLSLYREWAASGAHVKLQGATCLADLLERGAQLELAPEGAAPAVDFLRSLDVFYYRTGSHVETFGRVVFEAMACGLPVVCHRRGGYANSIRHGENGFLFDTSDEAREIMRALLDQPALRAAIGKNARRTVEALYSRSALARRAQFYLRHAMSSEAA
ncbi:glycosyltransferase family 4 protein [Paraburkholderia sp. CNPSo 3272]|uniref:glycosyltransferase family 4 protein n=1 Tax=Paraburkholderia sp. CNPSo 3272 TaxID=2940931 RepID=UPI0020B72BF1|nr:glycosyltransferase family 4 protein [Paraburkholderia sp. CNPSo 3272]MCP3726889.1 glycosyltransferase family 4 protein [Paraburkholderia sp. CNPSo 3272]